MSNGELGSNLFTGDEELDGYEVSALSNNVVPEGYKPEAEAWIGKLPIEVHRDHAYSVLDRILRAYETVSPPYDQDRVRLPHDPRHMPQTLERGGVDHATFLFKVCYYMRGSIKSTDAVIRMARVYDSRPDLFDVALAQYVDPAEIAAVLRENGLGFQARVARQWVENSRRLADNYDGDPRNIFAGVDDYSTSLNRVMNDQKGGGFIGFQQKMTSMILYYLMDEELIEPFNFPIPVDLHVMRVSIANKMIAFPGVPHRTNLYRPETTATLRQLYFDYAADRNISALRLCDAVWMLSESSCGRHPGNRTHEPHGRGSRNGLSTYLVPVTVNERDSAQQAAYASACGVCPVESSCQYNLPGTPYYISGALFIRGRRVRFPLPLMVEQEALFDI